ncbi:ACP S-malonyltransferase [Streptomyces sp. NPDC059740]|uniref:ACP S-malonyltransferase n=1 Tax=Streptomyces sp. NPDC059740 TaxID=3346926 RepID=UPI00365C8C77
MDSALLFPGQGAQVAGMLHRLPPGPATDRTLAEAAELLGRRVGPGDDGSDALDGPTAMASDTTAVQLALLVAGTATFRTLEERGAAWEQVAGHSVGAFTAAVAAGVLSFPDALGLVRLRGESMAELFPPDRGHGMVALTGLPESRVARLAEASGPEGCRAYPSNVNAPDQVTVSGPREALRRVVAAARAAGARKAVALAVPVPAHCPLMAPVRDRLAAELRALADAGRLSRPRHGYAADLTGRVLRTARQVAEDLAESTARPVRWHDATTALYERGVRLFVEAPPGTTLTRLAAGAFPDVRSLAVAEGGVDSAVVLLGGGRG